MNLQTGILRTTTFAVILASVWVTTLSTGYFQFPGKTLASMVYLGAADGKGFFADGSVSRNWTAARQLCIDSNMQLASITSDAQASLLAEAYNRSTFNSYHWTAGRDAQSLTQLIWDTDNRTLMNDSFLTLANVVPISACLLYDSIPNASTIRRYWMAGCQYEYRVLCEATFT